MAQAAPDEARGNKENAAHLVTINVASILPLLHAVPPKPLLASSSRHPGAPLAADSPDKQQRRRMEPLSPRKLDLNSAAPGGQRAQLSPAHSGSSSMFQGGVAVRSVGELVLEAAAAQADSADSGASISLFGFLLWFH